MAAQSAIGPPRGGRSHRGACDLGSGNAVDPSPATLKPQPDWKEPVRRNFFFPGVVRRRENVVLSKIDAMPSDPSQALEPFRSYLEVLARVHLDTRLRGKLDPADVVQQALLRAHAAWPEMKNPDQPALAAWLRRILARTLADVVKHYDRDKRAVDLERSLEADLDRSSSGLAGWLAADQTSPSQVAVRNEELLRLADALAALPEPQREVVVLKHLRSWTLQRIAEHLGRTVPSVASLLRRGLEELRRQLAPKE